MVGLGSRIRLGMLAIASAYVLAGCGAGLRVGDRGPSLRPSGGARVTTTELSIDRAGGDYGALRARDLTSCRAACEHDRRCRAFSYYVERPAPGGLTCFLKARVPAAIPREGVISGRVASTGGGPTRW